jgi:acyl-CoA oxidase
MSDALLSALQDPQLRPFLPLVYVAWADGELDDEELVALRERLAAQPWVAPTARAELADWLDPAPARARRRCRRCWRRCGGRRRRWTRRRRARSRSSGRRWSTAIRSWPNGHVRRSPRSRRRWGWRGSRSRRRRWAEVVRAPAFDLAALRGVLDGPHAAARAEVRAFLAEPGHRASFGISTAEQRALCHGWLQELARRGFGDEAFPGVTTRRGTSAAFLAKLRGAGVRRPEPAGQVRGAVRAVRREHLSPREREHRELLAGRGVAELVGCFAMSETGHGSNVADIETTARYDAATRRVRDPHAARVGAQGLDRRGGDLRAHGDGVRPARGGGRGPRGARVPGGHPRRAGGMLPGVHAADSGHKMGLNGVDNGRLWFDQVRVPRSAMLDRFARVTGEGKYESEIPSPSRRFFTMLGTLVAGRVSIASAAVSVAKVGLAVAIRYAAVRRQFGPPGGPETTILDYPAHQRRLLPALATTYALHFAVRRCRPAMWRAARTGARSRRWRRGSRRTRAGTRRGRCRTAASAAAVRGICRSTASRCSRTTRTCSRRSRATTRC